MDNYSALKIQIKYSSKTEDRLIDKKIAVSAWFVSSSQKKAIPTVKQNKWKNKSIQNESYMFFLLDTLNPRKW